MARKRLRVGIAGLGFIGPAHLEALRRLDVHVLGVASSTQKKAAQRAAELGVEKAYSSFEAMVADPAIDIVHIATPNHLHYPQAKAALLAGKHVVCEKPLALSTRESSELVALAAKTGRVNATCFNLRYYPVVCQMRHLNRSEQVGRPFVVHGSYLQDWLLLPTDWNWRLEPDAGGALRAVGDLGSHWLDLARFVTGLKVKAVAADLQTFLPVRKKPSRPLETFAGKIVKPEDLVDQAIGTEDYAAMLLRFENGAHGVVAISQVSAGRKNRLSLEISGSRSSTAWDSERPNELWIGHRDRPNELLIKDPSLLAPEVRCMSSYPGGHAEGYPDTFKQLFREVYEYIDNADWAAPPPFPTFADGHYVLQVSEAIAQSASEGRWVEVAYRP